MKKELHNSLISFNLQSFVILIYVVKFSSILTLTLNSLFYDFNFILYSLLLSFTQTFSKVKFESYFNISSFDDTK